jgi:NADH dehydrogenase
MANVLVLGGTGFVGAALCEKLVERFGGGDARIVVPSRRPARAKHIQMLPTVELVAADVHDDARLTRLLRRLRRSRQSGRHPARHAKRRSTRSMCSCRAASPRPARQRGVRRVIHVSALGVDAHSTEPLLRSKAAGEAALRHRRWT